MAILVKGKTFTSTEQVTSTKLHQLVDSATFDPAAADGSTLEVSSGALRVKDAGITGAKLSATVAIPTGATAVTQAANTNTTAIATTAFAKKEADDAESAANAFSIQRANHTGTQAVGTITGLGALATTGTAAQICKAWVNFNGTSASPITPTAAYNVSSVTKTSTGVYRVNFTSNLGSSNFCATGMISIGSTSYGSTDCQLNGITISGRSISYVDIKVHDDGQSVSDNFDVNVIVFGA